MLVCHVSSIDQDKNNNLNLQEQNLRRQADSLGVIVADVFRWVGSGWEPEWLMWARCRAIEFQAGFLFAESTDRFVRSHLYHSQGAADAQATELDLRNAIEPVAGVRLVTVLDPNADPSDVRSYQTRRGQHERDRKGGRPRALRQAGKERRSAYLPIVKIMRAGACSGYEIAKYLNSLDDGFPDVSDKTVYNWINREQQRKA